MLSTAEVKADHRVAERDREESGEDDRVDHAVQRQALEIFESQNFAGVNMPER